MAPVSFVDGGLSFTPTEPGAWQLDVSEPQLDGGGAWSWVTEVVTPATPLQPCLTLPRACTALSHVAQGYACDGELYDGTGQVLASLDGGRFFGTAEALFAVSGRQLSQLSLDGGALIATPLGGLETVEHFAVGPGQLATSTGQSVTVWALDGGAASGRSVDAFFSALVWSDAGLQVVSDSLAADERGFTQLVLPVFDPPASVRRVTFAAAGGLDELWSTELVPGTWLTNTSPSAELRRPLRATPWGVQLASGPAGVTGSPMQPVSTDVLGVGDDIIWFAFDGGTQVYCQ
jgi:hypothetical protein